MNILRSGPDLIGESVEYMVCSLLSEHTDITSLEFFIPPPVPPIQARVRAGSPAQEIISSALALRNESGLPFWDAANLKCFGEGEGAVDLITEALFHNGPPRRRLQIRAGNVTVEGLRASAADAVGVSFLALSSKVETNAGIDLHIPMLDFHCPESAQNLELVRSVMRLLNVGRGYIVASGKSYHFYGRTLVNDQSMIRFLARALLLSPIVDRSWIAHQLIEGACGLRISARSESSPLPRVVAAL